MPIPVILDRSSTVLLQGQIFAQIRRLILEGHLPPGSRLPASRALAEGLEVSRNTIMLVYERLTDEGYIESRGACGTFVSTRIPQEKPAEKGRSRLSISGHRNRGRHSWAPSPPPYRVTPHRVTSPNRGTLEYDFWSGRPDGRLFPLSTWRRLVLRRLSGRGTRFGEYGSPAGLGELRRAIATHVGITRGIRADPEQIVITGGIQEGISIVAALLLKPGAVAMVEDPCYTGVVAPLELRGARIHPVEVDREGVVIDRLPASGAAVGFLTPSHQYPLGGTLTLERRFELLAWAARVGAYIVEDDYDCDFRYAGAPLTALKGIDDAERVIHLGTFSKSLGPGLRLGFAVLPPDLVERFVAAKAALNNAEPWLEQSALAEFIVDGGFSAHLRRLRKIYMARRDCVVEALRRFGEPVLGGADAGLHLAWELPPQLPPPSVLAAVARRVGVGIYGVTEANAKCFTLRPALERTVTLGYAAMTEDEIATAFDRISIALEQDARIAGEATR